MVKFAKFQLILVDHFKVYVYVVEIGASATALIGWLNNHGKVCTIFNEAQADISKDRNNGCLIILTYLMANLM
jgi:hypothetical protein